MLSHIDSHKRPCGDGGGDDNDDDLPTEFQTFKTPPPPTKKKLPHQTPPNRNLYEQEGAFHITIFRCKGIQVSFRKKVEP
jgi:hypothetical protein